MEFGFLRLKKHIHLTRRKMLCPLFVTLFLIQENRQIQRDFRVANISILPNMLTEKRDGFIRLFVSQNTIMNIIENGLKSKNPERRIFVYGR